MGGSLALEWIMPSVVITELCTFTQSLPFYQWKYWTFTCIDKIFPSIFILENYLFKKDNGLQLVTFKILRIIKVIIMSKQTKQTSKGRQTVQI